MKVPSEPAEWVELRGGQEVELNDATGRTRRLKVCSCPPRLLTELMVELNDGEPQRAVEIACGLPAGALDWIAMDAMLELLPIAFELNFPAFRSMVEARQGLREQSLAVLRVNAYRIADMIMDQAEPYMKSKLDSLVGAIGQQPSSGSIPSRSGTTNPTPAPSAG